MKKYLIISAVVFVALTVFLRQVFYGALILPQTFSIGPLVVHYYGLTMALAAAAGFYFAMKRASRFGLETKQAEDILFWVIIGGFIGARLYHVLSSISYYARYPLDVFKVWNGGLSIYGAVLGGILVIVVLRQILNLKFSILNLLDWLAPSVLLGQIIGRFGNLFNYEAFGYPTNLPWKMFVPERFRPEVFMKIAFYHPWFLYEIVANAIILIFLLNINHIPSRNFSRGGRGIVTGQVVFFYLLLYNSLRFCLEFLRIDSTFIYGFRLNAVMSLIIALTGLAGLAYVRKHPKTS